MAYNWIKWIFEAFLNYSGRKWIFEAHIKYIWSFENPLFKISNSRKGQSVLLVWVDKRVH